MKLRKNEREKKIWSTLPTAADGWTGGGKENTIIYEPSHLTNCEEFRGHIARDYFVLDSKQQTRGLSALKLTRSTVIYVTPFIDKNKQDC